MDRIWTFKTAHLEVFCEWEPEQDEDLSWADEETLEKLASEEWVNVSWHVGVLVNGKLYAEDYLGNSVYENPPLSFIRHHLGVGPAQRDGHFIYNIYFTGMVRQCLKETRKKLEREEDRRDNARRWLARYDEAFEHYDCKHGHMECSNIPGGRCLDETLQNYPELNDVFDGDEPPLMRS